LGRKNVERILFANHAGRPCAAGEFRAEFFKDSSSVIREARKQGSPLTCPNLKKSVIRNPIDGDARYFSLSRNISKKGLS